MLLEIASDAVQIDDAKPFSALGRFNDDTLDYALFYQFTKRPSPNGELMFNDRYTRKLRGDIFLLLNAGCFHT